MPPFPLHHNDKGSIKVTCIQCYYKYSEKVPPRWSQELHDSACDASVTLLNEMGLDPGIDHMLAMQCFDEVHSKGGKVG